MFTCIRTAQSALVSQEEAASPETGACFHYLRQPVSTGELQVVRVVSGRDLHRASANSRVHKNSVCDDGQQRSVHRMAYKLAWPSIRFNGRESVQDP